jgi:hypothetical protein
VIPITTTGYETAIYEIYPVDEAARPLLAGVTFEVAGDAGTGTELTVLATGDEIRLLNPDLVRSVRLDGAEVSPERLEVSAIPGATPASGIRVSETEAGVEVDLEIASWVENATLALLYEPSTRLEEYQNPSIRTRLDGADVEARVEQQEGRWSWHLIDVTPGSHSIRMLLEPAGTGSLASGSVSVWLVASHRPRGKSIRLETTVELDAERPMPPRPWPAGELRSNQKLGEIRLSGR